MGWKTKPQDTTLALHLAQAFGGRRALGSLRPNCGDPQVAVYMHGMDV